MTFRIFLEMSRPLLPGLPLPHSREPRLERLERHQSPCPELGMVGDMILEIGFIGFLDIWKFQMCQRSVCCLGTWARLGFFSG